MAIYVFSCDCGSNFERFVQGLPDKPPSWAKCPCGKKANRNMGMERVHFLGGTKTGTGRGSLHQETKAAFGDIIDGGGQRASRFSSTKELDQFLGGQNDFGPPIIEKMGPDGAPVFAKDKDGNILHEGVKLVKYGPNDGPSRTDNPKPAVNLRALDEKVKRYTGESIWDDEPEGSGWMKPTR